MTTKRCNSVQVHHKSSQYRGHRISLFFSVLTLSCHVVMVVMMNLFGVTGDERDCCSLGYLMTQNIVRRKKSSS